MASAEKPSPTDGRGGASGDRSTGEREARGAFWRELYWFLVVCIAGVTLAMAVLPVRAARHRSLLEFESSLQGRRAELVRQERDLEAAIEAIDSDPFYREAVYRKVLGVKRRDETFEAPERPSAAPQEMPREVPPPEDGPADFHWPRPEV